MSETKKGAKRTPRYPTVPLDEAVEKVSNIFRQENSNPMSAEVAAMHLGYKSYNGASAKVVSSLRKYGLLTGRGNDLYVSDDARLIFAESGADDQTERREALMRCLLSNTIFRELYDQFEGTSSEINIQSRLIRMGFRPDAASAAANSYKRSVDFAIGRDAPDQPVSAEIPADDEQENGETVWLKQPSAKDYPSSRADSTIINRAKNEDYLDIKQDTYTLDKGELMLSWPVGMSLDEIDDFDLWMDMMKRKVRKAVERKSRSSEGLAQSAQSSLGLEESQQ